MRSTFLISVACFTFLTNTAIADTAVPPGQAAANSEKITCQVVVHEGMMLRKARECHDADGWTRIRLKDQQRIREVQMKSLTGGHGW